MYRQMGYGRRAVQLLQDYYEGKRHSLSEQNSHSVMTPLSAASQVDYVSGYFNLHAQHLSNEEFLLLCA